MKPAVVITSINQPTRAVQELGRCSERLRVILVGDKRTPGDWSCEGVEFISLDDQITSGLSLASILPVGHYSRKNLGYLTAACERATFIAETDDDNEPYGEFLADVHPLITGHVIRDQGWVNVYKAFSHSYIWPRGLPLEEIGNRSLLSLSDVLGEHECLINQYLADGDPDVDAIYRLLFSSERYFQSRSPVILTPGSWSPFNSQNTVWWPKAYPLMYLPSHVSFRMTDIWRSFVAVACLQARGYSISFHAPTVKQVRNEHSLIRDFEEEIPGYLRNGSIMKALSDLRLGQDTFAVDLRQCWEALVALGVAPPEELSLVSAWVDDLSAIES